MEKKKFHETKKNSYTKHPLTLFVIGQNFDRLSSQKILKTQILILYIYIK